MGKTNNKACGSGGMLSSLRPRVPANLRKSVQVERDSLTEEQLGDFSRWIVVRAISHPEGSDERQMWTEMYERLVRPVRQAESGQRVTLGYQEVSLGKMIAALEEILDELEPGPALEMIDQLRQHLIAIKSAPVKTP